MKTTSVFVSWPRAFVLSIVLLMLFPLARGDDTASSSSLPAGTPESYTSLKEFPQNLGGNFLALFSKKNIAPLAIGSAATGVISIWDKDIRDAWGVTSGNSTFGSVGATIGGPYVTIPAVTGILILSHYSTNDRFHSFGYSLAQAMVIKEGLVQGLKFSVGRTRPDGSNNQSFPSGHAATAFAAAAVIQRYYGTTAGIIGYATAAFIAASRSRENAHWASDLTAGATLGYIVGTSVCRRTGISLRVGKVMLMPTADPIHRRFGVIISQVERGDPATETQN